MKAVVQRVSRAQVVVDDSTVGQIGTGLLVLLGVTHDDSADVAQRLAAKIWNLRMLRDEKSAADLDAGILVVSQFTLYGDARKGRRPT
jgi:D-tyrosyl-tRNA(Tyr) deacylase